MACGRRAVEVEVAENSTVAGFSAALAEVCPALVGVALSEDLSGLMESYTLNLNAVKFVEDVELTLKDGDSLLLFSSQAGG